MTSTLSIDLLTTNSKHNKRLRKLVSVTRLKTKFKLLVWINNWSTLEISPRMRGGSLIPKHLISPRNGLSWFTSGASVTQRVTEVLVHGNKMFSLYFENLFFIYRLDTPDWTKYIPVFISKYSIFIKTSFKKTKQDTLF